MSAIAMNRLGGKSNSGEGGENPERYILMKTVTAAAVLLSKLHRDFSVFIFTTCSMQRNSDQNGTGSKTG